MDAMYDGIILGAGHNSLVLQAYLGQAGFRTLCIERRAEAGGGLVTLEDPRHPGFYHNTHSFFHRAILQMPWFRDLGLDGLNVQYIEPPLNTALILRDGRALTWWTDFARTVESFASFSQKDADTLQRWRDAFIPIVEKIVIPESQAPPIPGPRRLELLQRCQLGRTLLEVSRLSPIEFVRKHFDNPVIQAGLLFFNGLREVDLRCRGFGHHIPQLLATAGKAQMAVGGAACLARGLTRAVQHSGGEIRLLTQPRRILIENDRAVGVETQDGHRIGARHFVVSGLNPHQTFLELIDEAHTPSTWRQRAAGFQYNLIAPLFGLNLNLHQTPQYAAASNHPGLEQAFMVILGLENIEQYPEIVEHHEQGSIPPTVMWGCCPTQFDPSQAPPGRHTAFMWEKLPYRLNGDPRNWDVEKHRHGRKMLELWKQYAPNLEGDTVIDTFTRSALDTERTFPNMREGDLLVGAFTNGQIGHDRPFPGAGHYRGHVKGLYLCGSCCHPGGNITGLPGYNCAQVLLADQGIVPKWVPENIQTQLERLS